MVVNEMIDGCHAVRLLVMEEFCQPGAFALAHTANNHKIFCIVGSGKMTHRLCKSPALNKIGLVRWQSTIDATPAGVRLDHQQPYGFLEGRSPDDVKVGVGIFA